MNFECRLIPSRAVARDVRVVSRLSELSYQDDLESIIYRCRPNDGTLDKLPLGAKPAADPRSTYDRTDGGDRFEFALFVTEDGETIVVQADGVPPIGRQS